MKKRLYTICILLVVLTACNNNDVRIFDETADERVAEAKAALKADLIAPTQGWRVKYKPESASGSFFVLLKFDNENNVTIKSDLGSNDGEFFTQTVTYRIDSSLGLELIIESYSFFSYLFEQNQATFGAEYEFNYANKTPQGELVFSSKTDPSNPTILLFEEASTDDFNLLVKSTDVSTNLNEMSADINRFSSALKLTYDNKDLIFYISLNDFERTIKINTASKKTNTLSTQNVGFSAGYLIKGDSIIFDETLSGTYLGINTSIKSIKLKDLEDSELDACGTPIPTHGYTGVTSANDNVILETSLEDANGKKFAQLSDFYYCPLNYIFDNGESASADIVANVQGAASVQLYYNYLLNDGSTLNGIGFVLVNTDGTTTFALKEFTSVLTNNNIVFNFSPGFRLFGNQNPDATLDNINIYLDELTQGDNTLVYEYSDNIYEFYNPCSGWSFVFVNGNQ